MRILRIFSAAFLAVLVGLFPLCAQAGDAVLLEELKSRYALEEKQPYEESIMQKWWEGRGGGIPVAFQARGKEMAIYAGQVEEVTDIYLVRITPGQSAESSAVAARLERIMGEEGKALASQFYLAAYPSGEFDMPQLRLPALRDGIPKLSPSVREVAIFEGHRGLSLTIDATGATIETVEADLTLVRAMIKALEAAPD